MRILGLIGAIITTIAGLLFAYISLGSYYFNGTSLLLIDSAQFYYESGVTLLVVFAVIAYLGHIFTYLASFKNANYSMKMGAVFLIIYTVFRAVLVFLPINEITGALGDGMIEFVFTFLIPVMSMGLGLIFYFIGCFKFRYYAKHVILTWIFTAFCWILATDVVNMIFSLTVEGPDIGVLFRLYRDNFFLLGLIPHGWVIALAKKDSYGKKNQFNPVSNTADEYYATEGSKSKKPRKKSKDEEVSFKL